MRKVDVFGRKQNQARPLYLLILVFVVIFAGYYLSNYMQQNELKALELRQQEIQRNINQLVNIPEEETYHLIGEIIHELPNQFSQYHIINDLNYIRSASGLLGATDYVVQIEDRQSSPYTFTLPSTIRFVKISVGFSTDRPERILDYLDYITTMDRFYVVSKAEIYYDDLNNAYAFLTIYSFYNDVQINS